MEQNAMADGTAGQQFLDRVPTAAALITPTGTALAVNERWAQLLDCRREELVGANALRFLDPEQLGELRDALADLAAGRRTTGMALPTRVRHADRWIEVVCTGLDMLGEKGFGGILVLLRTQWHETAAAARQGWFEAVVSGTDGSVQVVDEHGRFLWASGPLEEMFGLPAEAIVGRTVAQLGAPEVRAATTAWFESILRTPGPHPYVVGPHQPVEGREVQLEVRATNLLHDPEVRGIVLHTRDVSLRVEAEAARQVAIDVLARAPLAIVITDAAGVITSWNAASERILGWPAADVLGRRFRDIGAHTIDSFGAILSSLDRLLNGETVELETQVTTRDGETVPAYLLTSGMLLPDGSFGGFLVFGIDLREQVDVRSALANNEARWAALSRNTHDIVALIDEAATVVWAGAGFANQLGIEPASIIGTNIRDLVHPADRARPGGLDRFVRERERGGTYAREYRLRHANGSWRVLDITVTDLREEAAIGAFLVSGRDVTDRVAVEEANRRLAVAIDSAGAAVIVTNLDDQVSSWNHGAEALVGLTAEEALGQPLPLHPPPELASDHVDLLARTAAGQTVHVETELTRPDGELIPLSVTASPVFDAAGAVSGRSFVCFDATETRKADREREAREKQSTALAGLGQRALAGASVADVLRDACELVSHTLGVRHVHVVLLSADRRFHEIGAAVGLFEPSIGRRDPVEQREWAHLVNRGIGPVVIEDFDAPGAERPAALIGAAVRSGVLCPIDGRDGSIGFLGALDEVPRAYLDDETAFLKALAHVLATAIERARVSDEMRRRALHDELTGLPNRTLVLDRLTQALARLGRRGGTVALLFVDLDRFKRVNDTLGHGAGDEVLIATADRLLEVVRVGDTVARTGGDEFLVLSEEIAGPADAVALAERVGAAVAVPVYVAGHLVHVSASVGVAVTSEIVDADELIRDADLAMYRAKEQGRAQVQVFDATMRDEAMSRMAMEVALRAAVATDGIEVEFQPQVRMRDDAVIGIEALARWNHPRLGAVPPSAFVELAEEIDILDEITLSVLRSSCATLLAARSIVPSLTVAVNLTARQLGRGQVLELVKSVLAEFDLPADALVIELTETGVLDDNTALAPLTDLRGAGVRVAIDDFGTGYSSLARLTRLPVDEVKIDRSFVSGVDEDRGCAAVVSATVSLASVLGLRVIAEGVETDPQRRHLLELGCETGQGWLFSGPLDHDQLLGWLKMSAVGPG